MTNKESEALTTSQDALLGLYHHVTQNHDLTTKQNSQLGVLLEAISEISQDPNFSYAYIKAGAVMKQMGWLSDAKDAFDKAISLDDKNFVHYVSIGDIYLELAEAPDFSEEFLKDAIRHYEYALYLTDGVDLEDDILEERLEQVKDKLDDLYEAFGVKPSDTYDAHIISPAP